MTVSLSVDKLFEYVIAAILRECGYIAGVPTSELEGRGTRHQIDVMGIEFKKLPFLYDTVLVVEAKCYDRTKWVGIDTVRQLKSVLIDLDQTLPRNITPLPRNLYPPSRYFTNILGNEDLGGLTVNYSGVIFSTKHYSDQAREFANAHGIFLFHFPDYIGRMQLLEWFDMILQELSRLSESPFGLSSYLKSRQIERTARMLKKLRESYGSLEPNERHDLFTLIRSILTKNRELREFWLWIRWMCIATIDGYPTLTHLSKISPAHVLEHVLERYKLKRNIRKIGSRFEVDHFVFKVRYFEPLYDDYYEVGYSIRWAEDEGLLLEGTMYAPNFLQKLMEKGMFTFVLPFREGLNLIASSP